MSTNIQRIGDQMGKDRLRYAKTDIKIYCTIDGQRCSWDANIHNPRDCRKCPKSLRTADVNENT